MASGLCLSLRLGFTSYIRPHRLALRPLGQSWSIGRPITGSWIPTLVHIDNMYSIYKTSYHRQTRLSENGFDHIAAFSISWLIIYWKHDQENVESISKLNLACIKIDHQIDKNKISCQRWLGSWKGFRRLIGWPIRTQLENQAKQNDHLISTTEIFHSKYFVPKKSIWKLAGNTNSKIKLQSTIKLGVKSFFH